MNAEVGLPRSLHKWIIPIMLLGVTALAAYLRLRGLGSIGLDRMDDEDLMAIAVLGILEHGYPLFPSGMVYIRALPQLYLMAASAELFGYSDFALRLPSAIFGTATVPLSYLLARRMMSRPVALAVAALVCFSAWQIEVSRSARMYAPFAFFFLLTIFFYVTECVESQKRWPLKTLAAALISVSLQVLALSLVSLFLLHLLNRPKMRPKMPHLIFGCILLAAFGVYEKIQKRMFRLYKHLSSNSDPSGAQESLVEEAGSEHGLLQEVANYFYDPNVALLKSVTSIDGIYLGVFSVFTLVLSFWVFAYVKRHEGFVTAGLATLAVLASFFHQLQLAFWFALVALVTSQTYLQAGSRRYPSSGMLAMFGILLVSAFLWTAAAIFLLPKADGFVLGDVIQGFVNFPRLRPVLYFFEGRWFLIPLLLIASIVTIRKNWHGDSLNAQTVMLWSLIASFLLTGLFESQYRSRYNFQVDVLAYLLGAFGILVVARRIVKGLLDERSIRFQSKVASYSTVGFCLIALFFPEFSPSRALATTGADESTFPAVARKYNPRPHTDRKTTIDFVGENLLRGDLIASVDWVTTYAYLMQNDYWIRSELFAYQQIESSEELREIYLGSRVIQDGDGLQAIISQICDRRLWVMVPSSEYRRGKKSNESLEKFYREMSSNIVYKGLDGESSVYLFDRRSKKCTNE